MNKDYRQIHFTFLILVALALLAYSCSGPTLPNKNGNNNQPPNLNGRTQTSSPTPATSQVSQRNSSVLLTTKQQNTRPLTNNVWHDLHSGDRIATDANGEAEVKIENCMRVYVYQDSQFVRSACPKAVSRSGSAYCAAAGTSLFNNSCGSRLIIQTDTAEIAVEGTYFSVTYLPSEQLTVVLVLKGKVTVRSTPPTQQEDFSEAVEVTEGTFLISVAPDNAQSVSRLEQVVAVGRPVAIDRLESVATLLRLQPWLSKIAQQARADEIVVPLAALDRAESPIQSMIDCDCENISAGLLTGSYQQQCKDTETRLREELARTGNVAGKCDPVASGPKARPK